MNFAKLLRKTFLQIVSERLLLPRQKHVFCFLVNLVQSNSFPGGYTKKERKRLLAFRQAAFDSRRDI